MATEIKFGVVVDNKDIYETGKVRVLLFEQDLPKDFRNKSVVELKRLLANLDAAGNYIPWQKGTSTKQPDPYLADPFLPKQINLIPQEGQLVKVFVYSDAMYREYVGPYISSLDNQNESYVNSLNGYKNLSKKNLITNGLVNSVKDLGLFGDNSQVILGSKELFLRTNAQDKATKTKNRDQALFQQSAFNQTLSIDKTTSSVLIQPEKIISHLLVVNVDKVFREVLNQKTLVTTLQLINVLDYKNGNGTVGLTSSNYIPGTAYTGTLELQFTVVTDDGSDVGNYIEEIRQKILSKKIPELVTAVDNGDGSFVATTSTKTADITVTDYRQMTRGHAQITDRTEIDTIGFVITTAVNQKLFVNNTDTLSLLGVSPTYIQTNPKFYAKEKNNLDFLNAVITKYFSNSSVESKLASDEPRVEQVINDNPNFGDKVDTFSIQAARKILMLSTQVNPSLISNTPSEYGFTQPELANIIDPKGLQTYSAVRGELIVQTLNKLIDLFLAHGHTTGNTVMNSLEDTTRNSLAQMKEALNKKTNADLSGGPDILNQYIRLN